MNILTIEDTKAFMLADEEDNTKGGEKIDRDKEEVQVSEDPR